MTFIEYALNIRTLCQLHNCSVTSGVRSPGRNEAVGGVSGSRHMLKNGGKADDLVPDPNTMESRTALMHDALLLGLTCIDETDHVHIHDNP